MPNPPPWKDSLAKNLLRQDIESGDVSEDMAAKEVYNSRPEYRVYPYYNFATNLTSLRKTLANDSRPHPPEKWIKSKAKQVLREDIISGLVTPDMDTRTVYNMRDGLYHPYQFQNFITNLKNLRYAIELDYDRASEDAGFYGHDVAIVHSQGIRKEADYLPWHRDPAAHLLVKDVAEGKNKTMKPKEFRATRPEYQALPLKQFSDRIRQTAVKAVKTEARFLKKQAREDAKKG